MTVFNLQTMYHIAAYQSEWQGVAGTYSLLSPIQIMDRHEKCSIAGKNQMHLNMESINFVYIDNYKNVFLPVLRVDIKSKDIQIDSSSQNEFYTGLELNMSYNNSRTAKWEPILEPIRFDITYLTKPNKTVVNMTAGELGSSEGICINFSEELLEVILHCLKNMQTVIKSGHDLPDSPAMMAPLSKGVEECAENIYDSQFLVRNLTGYNFTVQTVGDRKGTLLDIDNMGEKYVSFVLDDEFSVKDTTTRSIILTFSPEAHHSNTYLPRISDYLLSRQVPDYSARYQRLPIVH
jgi:hypothetical protein